MNIEDLAKDTDKAKEPAKKKGYDDVEISDLSGEDDDNKKSKVKKLKKSEIRAKTDKKEKKEVDKKQPKTAKSEEVQQKTPVSKTTEEKTHEDKPANVMTIPKYQAAPLPAGSGTITTKERLLRAAVSNLP
ncbi:hypothetical protein ANCCEY_04066 [Ancylostoma ceylanicum]|uniref:Uncharacterized protein n=1 Tax=Ancylostoma ceylanicum TaxID=53326 RepID=A0A0D6LYG5_9BILA|nr:hypothetical protein ANCCEY_04066 [Ancylostoma ceylanicum]